MAQDLEKLVVQLSADLKSYENSMAKLSGFTKAQFKALKAEAANAGAASGAAFTGAAAGVERFGVAAGRASGNVRAFRGQLNSTLTPVGNLAAQFNDIGVQLAGGQSPFLIAIQQGTQINQVLGGQGALGAVRALGGAFLSLLNPVSLVTIGLIAAGGAAVQYFTGLLGDGKTSADELKKQSDLIQKVAKDWGDAVPAIAAYAAEVERATAAAELLEAASAAQQNLELKVTTDFDELKQSLAGVLLPIPELRQAFGELTNKINEGTATAEDFAKVSEVMASILRSDASPALADAKAQFDAFAASANSAAASAAEVGNQAAIAAGKIRDFKSAQEMRVSTQAALGKQADFVKEQERVNSLSAEQLQIETDTARVIAEAERAGTVINKTEALRLAKEGIAADERRAAIAKAETAAAKSSGGGGRDKAATEAEREAAAVVKLIEALQFEQSLIGLTDLEREKANALRRAGSAATAEQRAQIEALVSASYAEVEALKATEDQMERLKGLSKDVLGGMFEDMRDGVKGADLLANALNRVAESFANAGIDALIGGMFKPGAKSGGLFGGRFIPGIFHKGGTAGVDGYDHSRSFSPAVFANARRYHDGGSVLRAGEIPAILQAGETVLTKRQSAAGGTVVNQSITIVGAKGNGEIERMVVSGMAQATAQMRKEVPGIVVRSQLRD